MFPYPATTPLVEGSLADQSLLLRAAMVRAIKQCSLSRWEIASKISEATGKELTKAMLDKYCSESASAYRPPADLLAAFCVVTGSLGPLEIVTQPCGRLVLPEADSTSNIEQAQGQQLADDLLGVTQEVGKAAALVQEALRDHRVDAGERSRCVQEFLAIVQRSLTACAHLQRGDAA